MKKNWRDIFEMPYSLRELSKRCGVSFSTLSRLKRKRGDPEYLTLRRIESFLNGKKLDEPTTTRIMSTWAKLDGRMFKITLEVLDI